MYIHFSLYMNNIFCGVSLPFKCMEVLACPIDMATKKQYNGPFPRIACPSLHMNAVQWFILLSTKIFHLLTK